MSAARHTKARTAKARPARRGWSRAVPVAVGALLISCAGPAANAFWQTLSSSNFAAASADAVAAGTAPSTSVSGGSVTVSWAQGSTAGGRPVTGYTVARYATSSGGTKVSAGGACAGTVSSGLSCTEPNVPTGTWYYSVTPVLSLWQGAESPRSTGAVVDTTPPAAPAIVAPNYVNISNVGSVSVSGTAEASATVTLTVTDGGAAHTVTRTAAADSSGNWSVTGMDLTAFNSGTISYSATARDAAGNTGPAGTATSTKDVAAPVVSALSLANGPGKSGKVDQGDKVTIQFSEPMDASSICSNWASESSGTISADNAVTVSISSGNALTVSVAGTSCPTFRLGSVALAGSYYGSGTLTYKGTGAGASILNWAAGTLTITLGALATGAPNNGNQGAASPIYTPVPGITDLAGNPVTATTTGSTSRF